MNYIADALQGLESRAEDLRREWVSKTPFSYVVIDDFLQADFAERILATYPPPDIEGWDKTTFIHQRKKFTTTKNFPEPAAQFFGLVSSREFRTLMSRVTDIPNLLDDPEMVGGGLHQTIRGGFLDVHVDFNFHPRTKFHRRLNLILYMNKNWNPEWNGYLELWDMNENRRIEYISPLFNRVVVFETNEVSFHGHPTPLTCPDEVSRKSLAVYFYTEELEVRTAAPERNTLYKVTEGGGGGMKLFSSAGAALLERIRRKGVGAFVGNVLHRTFRKIRGLPSENN